MNANQDTWPANQAAPPCTTSSQLSTDPKDASHVRVAVETEATPLAIASPHDVGHEGRPNSKMGAAYVPSADEDHATKAHDIGARTDHSADALSSQPPAPDTPPSLPSAGGSTNPLQSTRQN